MASAGEGSDKYEVFTKWAEERGVEINGVEARRLPGRGFGLVTTKAIPADERILLVPKKAMCAPDTNLIKSQRGLNKASPHAQLAISVMSFCKVEHSSFAVWEATWPTNQDFVDTLPLCWTKEEQDLLPPSVTLPLERQRRDWEKDWEAVAAYCQARGWSEQDYRYYWMIVDSRSFHFNPPHAKTGSMVLCPFIDLINHGPSTKTCQVFQSPEGYQVVADRDYEPGEEILATYGAHSNDKLLVHYGFVPITPIGDPSPDDDVRLDHLIITRLSEDIQQHLQDLGFLGAYALIPATNELCFRAQVAVRAALLTCTEWEFFATNGEDLASDQSHAVKNFLRAQMKGYLIECTMTMKELKTIGEGKPRHNLMIQRWRQIRDALDAYLFE